MPDKTHFSHIVIGSGPGGAITAASLAESGREVLLIEEGAYYDLDDMEPFSVDEMKFKYRNNGLTLTLGNIKVNYVEGKCVGGGSEVNSGLYHRTPQDVLRNWREEYQVAGLQEEELEPYYLQCEKDVSISFNPGVLPKASLKLAVGAEARGWKNQEVPRWFKYNGKLNEDGSAQGIKMSMTQTYVPRFLQAGGKLMVETRCLKFRKKRNLIEVICRQKGKTVSLTCDYIFVCAGAVHTPNLLRKSGFSKNVGKSFLLHPTIKVTARFNEEINHENMGVPVHQVKEFAPDFSFGCSISSPPYLAMAMNDHPQFARLVNTNWKQMGVYYAMTNAEGNGKVTPVPGYYDPLVSYNLTEKEKVNLANGLRHLCELLLTAGAVQLFPSITGSPVIRSEKDLSQLPRKVDPKTTNLMTIHLFSSCPMGENKKICAANSYGKLHGEDRIFINDASLLPTALGVNPQGTIMAIAKRNVEHFIQNNK